ncbi:MAG: hypothetical protein KZQ93_21050 [Candidatus Thiodiazotropha sp. (ex Monitilora ramsayi)]|nr:hypothetical protein [Candidatus Thiodiazotropha sp. (ex Monitilora ramsayi)]
MFSICEGLLIAVLCMQLVLLFFIARQFAHFSSCVSGLRHYIRQVRRLAIAAVGKMDCDELIDGLLAAQDSGGEPVATQDQEEPSRSRGPSERAQAQRERLAALVAGGKAKQFLGNAAGTATVDQIDALDDAEIEKLYARYEARLGAAMTKTLGSAALQLYAGVASMFLPIPAENQPALIADLKGDVFVEHALSSATCELYHRYGMFLAPLTAALTTMKHCQFGHRCPVRVTNNDGEPTEHASAGEPTTQ